MSSVEKPYVLLIDDNEATCTLITAVLHRDLVVDVASDGHEAIEKLRTGHYAAILLDLRMPGADGFAVLEFLKESEPAALRTVLVVTASLTPAEVARAKSYNVCAVISKPFDVEALLDAVKQCASPGEGPVLGNVLSSGVILFLADLIRQIR
jgi:CheY-like chemotaxis protein